jgi:hypothetical protein
LIKLSDVYYSCVMHVLMASFQGFCLSAHYSGGYLAGQVLLCYLVLGLPFRPGLSSISWAFWGGRTVVEKAWATAVDANPIWMPTFSLNVSLLFDTIWYNSTLFSKQVWNLSFIPAAIFTNITDKTRTSKTGHPDRTHKYNKSI